MLMRRRATQAEYFDDPGRTLAEVRDAHRWLARVNRITRFEWPFRTAVTRALAPDACRDLTFLELGAGDGSLGRALGAWADGRGWRWKFTSLDLNPHLPALNPGGHNVVGDACDLPFPDRAFDVVVASTMTHHLPDDAAVCRHFSEAARVARRLVVVSDMQRSPLLYTGLSVLLPLLGCPPAFRHDGLLSVRRGWRPSEWRELARRAGLDDAEVRSELGLRLTLVRCRPDR